MPTDLKHQSAASIPSDDLSRRLVVAGSDDTNMLHLGIVGDTYTILLSGKDTAGRFCLIDMHVPPGGGPPPHRHDFEETFILLDGELQATFRGAKLMKMGNDIRMPLAALRRCYRTGRRSPFWTSGAFLLSWRY